MGHGHGMDGGRRTDLICDRDDEEVSGWLATLFPRCGEPVRERAIARAFVCALASVIPPPDQALGLFGCREDADTPRPMACIGPSGHGAAARGLSVPRDSKCTVRPPRPSPALSWSLPRLFALSLGVNIYAVRTDGNMDGWMDGWMDGSDERIRPRAKCAMQTPKRAIC